MTDGTVTGRRLGDCFLDAVQEATGDGARYGQEARTRLAHVLRVSSLVVEDGGAEDEVIAALVHEPADEAAGAQRLDQIRRRYGTEVAEIVSLCAERFDGRTTSTDARTADRLERIARASPAAVRVSLADSLDHVRGLVVRLGTDRATAPDVAGLPAIGGGAYYAGLARAYARRQPGARVDELARLARELDARNGPAGEPPTAAATGETEIELHARPGRTGGRIRLEAAIAPMSKVGIRELAANVSAVVADVAKSGRPAVVTKHGEPIAALVAIADLEDLLAARALRESAAANGNGRGSDLVA
jgi:prevent-host-death family protein